MIASTAFSQSVNGSPVVTPGAASGWPVAAVMAKRIPVSPQASAEAVIALGMSARRVRPPGSRPGMGPRSASRRGPRSGSLIG